MVDLVVGLKEAFDEYICRNEGLWGGFWAELERAIDESDEGEELTIKLCFKHCVL